MIASLLRASVISGALRLRRAISSRPDWSPIQAATFLSQTDVASAGLDLEGGCQLLALVSLDPALTPAGVFRECISAVARSTTPGWLSTLSGGRLSLSESLDENTYQCFRIAGAFDPVPSEEVLLWLDELASIQFCLEDRRNTIVGREGELLTIESETRRLKSLSIAKSPRWVALDDNRVGFDVESWNLDGDGNEWPILIEVKACAGRSNRFFLTRNEWETACRYPDQFQLHVWRLADRSRVIFTYSEICAHMPVDQGSGRWESVLVQLNPKDFAATEFSGKEIALSSAQ